jgi:ABC-type multidrug transport system fused ATPase/permease subunit
MRNRDLWTVIGRAKSDVSFRDRLFPDFEQTVKDEGYVLSDAEVVEAKHALDDQPTPAIMPAATSDIMMERLAFETKIGKQRLEQQLKRIGELSDYTVRILKDTIGSATWTFKTISWMNVILFAVGIGLFLFAAFYAVFSSQKIYSLVFGGLGTVTFISLFILTPMEKSQNALSNLVQAEISFMNYFEQITFWESFALTPQGNPPALDPSNIDKASEMLQRRSMETIDLLQKYVETEVEANSVKRTNVASTKQTIRGKLSPSH